MENLDSQPSGNDAVFHSCRVVANLVTVSHWDQSVLRFPSPPPFPLHMQVYHLVSDFILPPNSEDSLDVFTIPS
jgi:hypothetical protein